MVREKNYYYINTVYFFNLKKILEFILYHWFRIMFLNIKIKYEFEPYHSVNRAYISFELRRSYDSPDAMVYYYLMPIFFLFFIFYTIHTALLDSWNRWFLFLKQKHATLENVIRMCVKFYVYHMVKFLFFFFTHYMV